LEILYCNNSKLLDSLKTNKVDNNTCDIKFNFENKQFNYDPNNYNYDNTSGYINNKSIKWVME
jgi:hypothetical protein